ncbi:MAG TPA: hypothetical protein DCZ03_14990 [Gammaproteobacteria bacterium]|nr:hypothetical protein [Gammaproteobacteria bacterium]
MDIPQNIFMAKNRVIDNALFLKTEQCVRCASCAPRCPTYALSLNEAESPRGRITMIAGLATGQISATESLQQHLDNCLTCRACEQVCPAEVEVGDILDQGRALTHRRRWPTLAQLLFNKVLDQIIAHPKPLARLTTLARLKWVQRMAHTLGFGAWLPALSAAQPTMPLHAHYPSGSDSDKRVQLFVGCLGEAMQSHTLNAALYLLSHLGFSVQIPKEQTCCGALHKHRGEIGRANRFASQNLQAFSDPAVPVIYCATGCGVTLKEYQADSPDAFPMRLLEINEFIAQCEFDTLEFEPLHEKVLIHDPCSARYPLKCAQFSHQLLNQIEGLEIFTLANNQHCCGAAGTYMLSHPETAHTLVSSIVEEAVRLQVDYVVSSNIGCALHLGVHLPKSIRVCHPVELLAQQLISRHKLGVE